MAADAYWSATLRDDQPRQARVVAVAAPRPVVVYDPLYLGVAAAGGRRRMIRPGRSLSIGAGSPVEVVVREDTVEEKKVDRMPPPLLSLAEEKSLKVALEGAMKAMEEQRRLENRLAGGGGESDSDTLSAASSESSERPTGPPLTKWAASLKAGIKRGRLRPLGSTPFTAPRPKLDPDMVDSLRKACRMVHSSELQFQHMCNCQDPVTRGHALFCPQSEALTLPGPDADTSVEELVSLVRAYNYETPEDRVPPSSEPLPARRCDPGITWRTGRANAAHLRTPSPPPLRAVTFEPREDDEVSEGSVSRVVPTSRSSSPPPGSVSQEDALRVLFPESPPPPPSQPASSDPTVYQYIDAEDLAESVVNFSDVLLQQTPASRLLPAPTASSTSPVAARRRLRPTAKSPIPGPARGQRHTDILPNGRRRSRGNSTFALARSTRRVSQGVAAPLAVGMHRGEDAATIAARRAQRLEVRQEEERRQDVMSSLEDHEAWRSRHWSELQTSLASEIK